MKIMRQHIWILLLLCVSLSGFSNEAIKVPVLNYHNVSPTEKSSTTISTEQFESQMKFIIDNGYTVIPMSDLADYLAGKKDNLPTKAVVITADDGRLSVYEHMAPIVKKYKVPVTLFVYPSAISNANYAMTWEQLKDLQGTGLFTIQSHTYWHPNFVKEKNTLSPETFQQFVDNQLSKSIKVLETKMGTKVNLLAWPFGLFDSYLEERAKLAGYVLAFSIEPRPASRSEKPMAQPRYNISAQHGLTTFSKMLKGE
jgi:peptidoglycan/xylan/chitin deacetylase (PgdA/CDA1 family)